MCDVGVNMPAFNSSGGMRAALRTVARLKSAGLDPDTVQREGEVPEQQESHRRNRQ